MNQGHSFKGLFLFTFIAIATAVSGCKNSSQSGSLFKADPNIQHSFSIKTLAEPTTTGNSLPSESQIQSTVMKNDLAIDKAQLSINKGALEKEFLLQVEVITQYPVPQFTGYQSRIVMFRERGEKIYLVESSKGNNFAKNFSQDLLLAEYPILKENDQSVTIDFNQGMKRVFTAGDWTGHDLPQSDPFEILKVNFSYVDFAQFSKSNVLVIKQVAQMGFPKVGNPVTSETATYGILYYLSPYVSNPNFKPTLAPRNFDRLGFFEVSPYINDQSGTVTYATKQDISKPIVFAISANTPADYKQAVRDGILYWNKAFGKEVVQAINAPATVSAPDPDYNVVQWVDWDSAGMAYADAQMDPMTGEITHQQVYFTSAWARIGKYSAEKFVRQFNGTTSIKQKSLGLKGFNPQQLCAMNMDDAITPEAIQALISEGNPAKVLKVSQDLLREVVAHEIGHTLGLRHNFAGSASVNFPLTSRLDLFKKYLDSGNTPNGVVATSTVMDYNFYPEGMMTGDKIAKAPTAEEYDTKAIRTLFYGENYKPEEIPLYCPDTLVGQYFDCMPYDAGSSFIEWVSYNSRQTLRDLPRSVLETYIAAKNPMFGAQPTPISEVSFNAPVQATQILGTEAQFMFLYDKDTTLLKTARTFPATTETTQKAVRLKTVEFIKNEISRLGGLDNILLNARVGLSSKLKQKFSALLDNPQNLHGLGPDGKPFSFSSDELAIMQATANIYFDKLETELIKSEVDLLAKAPASKKLEDSSFSSDLATFLSKSQKVYLLATTDKTMTFQRTVRATTDWSVPTGTTAPQVNDESKQVVTFNLPVFSYSAEVRRTAATFLRATRAKNMFWGINERVSIQKTYSDYLETIVPKSAGIPADIKPTLISDYPQEMVQWLIEVNQIKAILEP